MTRICASRTHVDRAKLAGRIPLDPERAQRRCWPRRPVKFGSSIDTEVRHSSALWTADERYEGALDTLSSVVRHLRLPARTVGSFRRPIGCSDGLGPAPNGAGHHCSKRLRIDRDDDFALALVFTPLAPAHFRSFCKSQLRDLGCPGHPLARWFRVLMLSTLTFSSDRKDLASQMFCDPLSRASVSVRGAILPG